MLSLFIVIIVIPVLMVVTLFYLTHLNHMTWRVISRPQNIWQDQLLQWRRKTFQDGGAPSYMGRVKAQRP